MAEKKLAVRTGDVLFAADFGRANYKVLQMDDKMIAALKNGERLVQSAAAGQYVG